MKDKNCIMTLINAGKTLDKIQHPFMIKFLSKVRIEGTCLNIIKVIYNESTAKIKMQKS